MICFNKFELIKLERGSKTLILVSTYTSIMPPTPKPWPWTNLLIFLHWKYVVIYSETYRKSCLDKTTTFRALLEGGLVPSSATRLTMIEIAQTRGDSELLQQVVSCGNTDQPRSNEDPFNRYLMKGE